MRCSAGQSNGKYCEILLCFSFRLCLSPILQLFVSLLHKGFSCFSRLVLNITENLNTKLDQFWKILVSKYQSKAFLIIVFCSLSRVTNTHLILDLLLERSWFVNVIQKTLCKLFSGVCILVLKFDKHSFQIYPTDTHLERFHDFFQH